MAAFYCQVCDRYIDLDWDVEHYDRCPTLPEEDEETDDPKISTRIVNLKTEVKKVDISE